MKQEVAVNRILRDMEMSGLIEYDEKEIFRPFLDIVWVAGKEWRRGTPSKNGISLVQKDRDGKIIGKFDNVLDASRKLKIPKFTIYHALYEKRITHKGHFWEQET
jgi:hypothetical protein